MRQLIFLFCILNAITLGRTNFLGANPYTSSKVLTLTLDDQFRATGVFPQLGQINIPFSLYSNTMYFTSPQCLNCQIYGDDNQWPFICQKENFCREGISEFDGVDLDPYYVANGNYMSMEMKFDDVPAFVPNVMYVQSINQKASQETQPYYEVQKFGLAFDSVNYSPLLLSLKESGNIEDFAISLYYGKDSQYHLMIGGFDVKLISKQFYNILNVKPLNDYPYNYRSDFLQTQFSVNKERITKELYYVQLDPTIDYFIFPKSFVSKFETAYINQSIIPDLSDVKSDQPGLWSRLEHAPSLTVSFLLKDDAQQSNYIDVTFSREEFMIRSKEGFYTPNMVFQDIAVDQDKIIVMGKQIFQKMMYYKHSTKERTIRCLAPLKNNHLREQ